MALGFLLAAVGIAFTVLYLNNYYVKPEEDKTEPTNTTLPAMTGTYLLHNITTTIETTTPTEITTTKEAITEATEVINITEATTTISETTTMNATPPEKIDTTTTIVSRQMALTTTATLPPWMKRETTTGITIPDDYKEDQNDIPVK